MRDTIVLIIQQQIIIFIKTCKKNSDEHKPLNKVDLIYNCSNNINYQCIQTISKYLQSNHIKMSISPLKNNQQQSLQKRIRFLKKHYKFNKTQRKCVEYFCFCDKKYRSFAAIYLHAKIKHSFKLKSILNSEACQIVMHRNKTTIKFRPPTFIGQSIIHQKIQNDLKQDQMQDQVLRKSPRIQRWKRRKPENNFTDIKSVLQDFRKTIEITLSLQQNNVIHKVIIQFQDFLIAQILKFQRSQTEIVKLQELSLQDIQAQNIPTYFNKFIMNNIIAEKKLQNICTDAKVCQILQGLAKWMFINKKTSIRIQSNQSFLKSLQT